jgi:hypothetical protein
VLSSALTQDVHRKHLWLAQAPDGVQQCVWDVVALAALNAMERGRRYLRAKHPRVTHLLERACTRAVADFWASLHDFAGLGEPPKGWGDVSASHPLLAVENGSVVVRVPA